MRLSVPRFALLAFSLCLLSGCAGGPQVIEGNERSVLVGIDDPNNAEGALTAANTFCAQCSRIAQFKAQAAPQQLAYDCVQ